MGTLKEQWNGMVFLQFYDEEKVKD